MFYTLLFTGFWITAMNGMMEWEIKVSLNNRNYLNSCMS